MERSLMNRKRIERGTERERQTEREGQGDGEVSDESKKH